MVQRSPSNSSECIRTTSVRRCAVRSNTRTILRNGSGASVEVNAAHTQRISSKDTGAGAVSRLGARHAANDWRRKLIVPGSLPVEGFANMGQHPVGHNWSILVFNLVKHFHNVAALHLVNGFTADSGANIDVEGALGFIG